MPRWSWSHLRSRRKLCCRCVPVFLIFVASTLAIMCYTPLNHDIRPSHRDPTDKRQHFLTTANITTQVSPASKDWSTISNLEGETRLFPGGHWPCLHHSHISSNRLRYANCSRVYIGTSMGGRLGNIMFTYAATLGIAHLRKATPVSLNTNEILVYFQATMGTLRLDEISPDWAERREDRAMVYDDRVKALPDGDLHLTGYFQSWKYFSHLDVRKLLRDEFQFKFHIMRRAQEFIQRVLNIVSANANRLQQDIRLVGIHIRRGDMMDQNPGELNVAPLAYIQNAIRYFLDKYNQSNVAFVVSTDAKNWVTDNIITNKSSSGILHTLNARRSRIFLSDARHYSTDMAILSLCGDVIITVGTFGWWAGWLSQGVTVYYKGYPHPESGIYHEFKTEDYYPPSWIGLS